MATAQTVFVSHKKEDAGAAQRVANRLQHNGLGVYLDLVDTSLAGDGPALGEYIRRKLGECTQLMAVVSAATQQSWWVPWEIGVATEKSQLITAFLTQDVTTPGYLQKWPYLRTESDIDLYARFSVLAHAEIMAKARPGAPILESYRAAAATDFHRTLKRALGQ